MEVEKKKIGCVIMASGIGKRFGSNKLLTEFGGKPLIEWVLDATDGEIFADRVVVTRHPEVVEICERKKVHVVIHDKLMRNDTVRIGLEHMPEELDGCMFCPADQPLLGKVSLKRVTEKFEDAYDICRLSFQGKAGAPVLFGKIYYEELKKLPEGKGGNEVVKKYDHKVKCVEAEGEWELIDVDVPQTLIQLERFLI